MRDQFILPFLFLFLIISCKENSTEPTDSEKPTVAILYPGNGAEIKADTLYKIIADASDNKGVTKVEFYIDGQNTSSDSSSPYEYNWNTTGLSGDHTIMAKGYDAANNIGTSSVISVKIKGIANHAPAFPSNPNPLNTATGISTSPTLNWICSDPDGDALTYDVYFGTSNNPTTTIATNQTATSISRSGLVNSTTYYWKIVAKDSKGAITTGPEWSFTTYSIISQDLVQVTGGTFTMGSNNANDNGASPPHSVTLGSFSIDKYEIAYENWTDVRNWGLTHGYTDLPTGQNGYHPNGTNNPSTMVNWYDILKWCNARSEKDGLLPLYYTDNTQVTVYRTGQLGLAPDAVKWTANGYRLPTEAEWEFAARGGISSQGYTYSGSNIVDNVAWYSSNSGNATHTVGTKSANELGIYDMSGNVWEWCWDWYGSYSSTAQTDPKGVTSGSYRVLRGGSLDGNSTFVGVAVRNGDVPNLRGDNIGFRCVRD